MNAKDGVVGVVGGLNFSVGTRIRGSTHFANYILRKVITSSCEQRGVIYKEELQEERCDTLTLSTSD